MDIAEKALRLKQDFDDVKEAGKTAEHNEFWEETHNNMLNGANCFTGYHWTDNNFKPIRDIVVAYGERIFSVSGIQDLRGCLQRQGVVLDTSKATTMAYAFSSSKIKYLPVIDCSGVNRTAGMQYLISTCSSLIEVEKIILPDPSKISNYNGMLTGCSNLERVIFEGAIGKIGLNLSGSPKLDHESLMSVINCLAPTSTAMTVTLGATNLAKLTDDEKAIATEKGWTLA